MNEEPLYLISKGWKRDASGWTHPDHSGYVFTFAAALTIEINKNEDTQKAKITGDEREQASKNP